MKERAAVYDVPEHHKTLWSEQQTENTERIGRTGDKRAAGFSDGFMPELFHRLYATVPSKVEKPGAAAAVREKVHNLVSELPEFESLRKQTVRDELWAGMATAALSESVTKVIPQPQDGPPDDADEAQRVFDGLKELAAMNPEAFDEHLAQAQQKLEEALNGTGMSADTLDESGIRQAMRAAIGQATQDIRDAEGAMASLGYGQGAGTQSFRSAKVAMQLCKKVKGSRQLRDIVEMAGRLISISRAKRMNRTDYARNEMVGVAPTGDLARILPSEMLRLTTPVGAADLMHRLLERSAMGYDMKGKEKVGKGPIVLCLDQSGSMSGTRDTWGKAVALALLDSARTQKRPFGIILYDDYVHTTEVFPDPHNVDPDKLIEILSTFSGGGTSFRQPLERALDIVAQGGKFSKADVVHITDGGASSDGATEAIERANKIGCQIYGISIGPVSHSLTSWSHSTTMIDDVNNDTKALDTIFDNVG